jgi:hypothetical protein
MKNYEDVVSRQQQTKDNRYDILRLHDAYYLYSIVDDIFTTSQTQKLAYYYYNNTITSNFGVEHSPVIVISKY